MKYIKCRWLLAMIMSCSLFSCTNLDEEVFDRVDAGIYYQDETSVQGAVAAIYSKAAYSYLEYFWYLQEFSADQVAWRSWNGGLWGWDEKVLYGEHPVKLSDVTLKAIPYAYWNNRGMGEMAVWVKELISG